MCREIKMQKLELEFSKLPTKMKVWMPKPRFMIMQKIVNSYELPKKRIEEESFRREIILTCHQEPSDLCEKGARQRKNI